MELRHSVEALISSNGKNYKGTLDFYDDKCILHKEEKTYVEFCYDIHSVEFETGITQISFMGLYTKDKMYLMLKTASSNSPLFIIDEENIKATLSILRCRKNTLIASIPKDPSVHQHCPKAPREPVKMVEDYNDKALNHFLANPYAILGVAANSSFIVADDALNKIKKLERLKAISSYKTDYALVGFDKIKRDLPMCQNALVLAKELKYRWLWFNSVQACQNWQFNWYREPFVSRNPDTWSYDVFLAQYLSLLCFDSSMSRRQDWYDIFAFYQYVVGGEHVEFLRTKLDDEQNSRYSDNELINNFSQHIFEPLNDILESSGIEAMLSFFRSLRMDRFGAMKEYKRNLGGKIAQWFVAQESILWNQIEAFIGTGELNEEATYVVREAVKAYDEKVQSIYTNALAALTKEPLRAEMVKASYSKVMRQVMILLLAGNCKAEACKYADRYYPFADKDLKLKLIATFGIESIDGAASDLPELMKELPKKQPEEPMVRTSEFDDITICENSFLLPRVDFCGLEFNGQTLGLRFWLMNRTSTELKFWLMNIYVNEEYCNSTEILATVAPGENDFYSYELSLPDDMTYSSINQIEFYVEIDKPVNETIHDTSVVKIKCDTRKEVLSVEYEES